MLAWLAVLVAAAVLCTEAVQMLRGGFDGFQEHVAGRAPQQQLWIGVVPLVVLVMVPRWARILLSVSHGAWTAAVGTILTVAAIIGSLAAFPVVGLSFDLIGDAAGAEGAARMGRALLQGTVLALLVWTLLAPFTHLIGVWPRYPRRAHVRAQEAVQALLAGDVLRVLGISMLIMIGFWVVATGAREDEPYRTGIAEVGADPWMTVLLIAQLLLLIVVRFVLPHRVDRVSTFLTAGALVIVVGVLAGIDLVLTWRFGIFHAVAAAPLLLMLPSLVREARRSSD